jgi:hypothetical protein
LLLECPASFEGGRVSPLDFAHSASPVSIARQGSGDRRDKSGSMVHAESRLEPTEADIREMREALDGDELFLKIAEDQKLFEGMLKIKWVMELYDDVAELSETTKRTAYARKLQTRLEGVIEILNQDEGGAHLLQAMARMRDMRGLTSNEVVKRVADLQIDLRDLLRASKQARPRKKDPPRRPDRRRRWLRSK